MVFRPGSPLSHPASAEQGQIEPQAFGSLPRTLLLWLSVGVFGDVLFTVIYLIEGATRPAYNAWQQPVSALSLGPGGWVQQANFIVLGICILCMAVAWRRVLTGGTGSILYPLIRSIEGLATILVGFFSQDPFGYPPGSSLTHPTLHGEIHIIGAFVIIGALTLGFLVMAWRFIRELHWWGWAAYSVLSAIVTLVLMALFGMALPIGGAAGLFERLATSTETLWGILLLARLWRGARFMRLSTAVIRPS